MPTSARSICLVTSRRYPRPFAAELADLKSRTAARSENAAAEQPREEYAKAVKVWHRAEDALIPIAGEQEKALLKHAGAAKKAEDAGKALAAAEAAVAARRDAARALAEATAKAQDVVKKLPKEKDLADAARVFATRSVSASTEVAALEKASVAQAAALKKLEEDRTGLAHESGRSGQSEGPVGPRGRIQRRRESHALDARHKTAETRVALEDQERRVAAVEAYAKWHGLRERIAANRHARSWPLGPRSRRAGSEAASTPRSCEPERTRCVWRKRSEPPPTGRGPRL